MYMPGGALLVMTVEKLQLGLILFPAQTSPQLRLRYSTSPFREQGGLRGSFLGSGLANRRARGALQAYARGRVGFAGHSGTTPSNSWRCGREIPSLFATNDS